MLRTCSRNVGASQTLPDRPPLFARLYGKVMLNPPHIDDVLKKYIARGGGLRPVRVCIAFTGNAAVQQTARRLGTGSCRKIRVPESQNRERRSRRTEPRMHTSVLLMDASKSGITT